MGNSPARDAGQVYPQDQVNDGDMKRHVRLHEITPEPGPGELAPSNS